MKIWPNRKSGRWWLWLYLAIGVVGFIVLSVRWGTLLAPTIQGGRISVLLEDQDLEDIDRGSWSAATEGLLLAHSFRNKGDLLRNWVPDEPEKSKNEDPVNLANTVREIPWFKIVHDFPKDANLDDKQWDRPIPWLQIEGFNYDADPWEFWRDHLVEIIRLKDVDLVFQLWEQSAWCIASLNLSSEIHGVDSRLEIAEFDHDVVSELIASRRLSLDQLEAIENILQERLDSTLMIPAKVIAGHYMYARWKIRGDRQAGDRAFNGSGKNAPEVETGAFAQHTLLIELAEIHRKMIEGFDHPIDGTLAMLRDKVPDFTDKKNSAKNGIQQGVSKKVEDQRIHSKTVLLGSTVCGGSQRTESLPVDGCAAEI